MNPSPPTSEANSQRRTSSAPEPRPLNDPRSLNRRLHLLPIVATVLVACLGLGAVWILWRDYIAKPWTRDGTVRAYVVTLAPEVSGSIEQLPVKDNEFVRKGDLLMTVDPRDYKVAVDLATASLDEAQADYDNKKSQRDRRLALSNLAASKEEQQTYISSADMAKAQVEQQKANLQRAETNLQRTEIRAPVTGWVTNLLTRQGDFVTVGQTAMSIVDTASFWVDGYFEETALSRIEEGEPAKIWLLGYGKVLDGHVDSVARGIVVSNATPGKSGLATVNPVFTWVRLAQRIPVRIHIDKIPPDIKLVVGMTASVEVEPQSNAAGADPIAPR